MSESFNAEGGVLLFESRADAEQTLNIIYLEFARLGMQIHRGFNGLVPSKTQALIIPRPAISHEPGDT